VAVVDIMASGSITQAGAARPTPSDSGSSYMEELGRADARRQIRASAGVTYLSEIVAASHDSMLHRWDGRYDRPVRVYVPRSSRAANFQSSYADAVRAAFRSWEDVGLPVRFDLTGDSTDADATFGWRAQFEIERTGQTDLQWDGSGRIQSGVVTLATFDPEGRPMGPEEMRVVALHEIGHLLGLDHSPDSTDVMFTVVKVRQLSRRDIETARMLYRLSPGTLR
jgi:predicted Zn-dependent protease